MKKWKQVAAVFLLVAVMTAGIGILQQPAAAEASSDPEASLNGVTYAVLQSALDEAAEEGNEEDNLQEKAAAEDDINIEETESEEAAREDET